LDLRVVVDGNSAPRKLLERERAEEVVIRWGKVQRVGRIWENLPAEFLNGRFRHACSVWSGVVMLKNHSVSSTRAILVYFFLTSAKLLTIAFSSDGQVPLKQFIMDNPPPYPTRFTTWPPRARSVIHVKIALLEARKPFLGCSFSKRVFSVDGTNVSGDLCSFGASTELVKKKVSEMFIFLNFTLHSFGSGNFIPLFQIEKFENGLIEENERCKVVYYTSPTCNSCWEKFV
jgi:hypothetical protein